MKKNKNKSFINKYIKIILFVILLIVSFGLTVYLGKAEDLDENKFTVDSIKIKSIKDGLSAFDSAAGNGNDINDHNGIVRTFDGITYSVEYKFHTKDSSYTPQTSSSRTLIVDVLFDKPIEGTLKVNNHTYAVEPIFGSYSYVEFNVDQSISQETNSISFTLDDIYAHNNPTITPKVFIKESTDSVAKKNLDILSDTEKAGTIPTTYNTTTTCENSNNSNNCSTAITSTDSYVINLFEGGFNKDESTNTKDYKIGYMVGLQSDSTKGIKGKHIPESVTFSINATKSNDGTNISFGEEINQEITDELSMESVNKLVTVPSTTGNQNGTFDGITPSNNSISIKIKDIKNYHVSLSSNNYVAFSTGMLLMHSVRQNQNNDINISLSVSATGASTNTLLLEDKHTRYIGKYSSIINLYEGNKTNTDLPKPSGRAIYNYGDQFMLENEISYATSGGGDELESLTHYVKIDNDAFKLIEFGDSGSHAYVEAEFNTSVSTDKIAGTAKYYYGEWNSNYFRINPNAPSGCPTSLPSTKEQIMNLFGGPCIVGTDSLKSSNDYASHIDGISDSLLERGPLMVAVTFNSTNDKKIVNNTGSVKLKLRVKNYTSLINNTYQIVSSAVGNFNDGTTTKDLYLGNNVNDYNNGLDIMKNPSNYNKTIYNPSAQGPDTIHSNVCNIDPNNGCAVNGNTIVVAAVESPNPSVKTYYNEPTDQKTEFHYYPIRWLIDVTPSLPNDSAGNTKLEESIVDAYLPDYLIYAGSELEYGYNSDGQTSKTSKPIEPIITTNASGVPGVPSNYNKYTFKIIRPYEDNFQSYAIKLYTNIKLNTPNNTTFNGFFVTDNKVSTSVIEGSTVLTREYRTLEPITDRITTSSDITIHNSASVTTQGDIITNNRTRYMEKNDSYKYNMKAYNNSSHNIDKANLYYVLPYNGDSPYEDLQSKISATNYKVKLEGLPAGYKAYYSTGGVSANIISNEMNSSSGESNSWVEWNNPTMEISGANAIKIEKIETFNRNAYFGDEAGITVVITPEGADVGDIFYNQFYIITGTNNDKVSYPSSRNEVSIYNRGISGFVWEDYDYDGLYNNEESKLENIPVSLYKISDDIGDYDPNDPTSFVGKAGEEWISDTTTDTTGNYKFSGLSEGKYYVKFSYSDKKYTVTKRDAKNIDGTSANAINSKARGFTGDVAISNIVIFDVINNASIDNLNLGLTIKKEFAVDVNNYIKNVTITSQSGTNSYDYDKQSTVSISLRNTRNKSARVTYEFVLENTKYFPGYIGLIQDVMPAGFTFNKNIKENQDWVYTGGVLYYTGLSGKLLVPNEKYYFNLVLDYEITEGGNYINFVSLDNLVLMGDEIPEFEFNEDPSNNTDTTNTTDNNDTNTNNGEGN